jgi:hypothetical protein
MAQSWGTCENLIIGPQDRVRCGEETRLKETWTYLLRINILSSRYPQGGQFLGFFGLLLFLGTSCHMLGEVGGRCIT